MTWTKIASELVDDPRLLRLDRSDRWTHIEGMVWANKHGTDGHIPRHTLRRVTDNDDAEESAACLVAVGLWKTTVDGWQIVDFLDDQPSAEDVDRTRALGRDRQRKQRQHRNGDHTLCDPRYCHQSRVTNVVSHDTRAEPYRAEGTRVGEGEAGHSARAPRPSSPGTGGPGLYVDPNLSRDCDCGMTNGYDQVPDGAGSLRLVCDFCTSSYPPPPDSGAWRVWSAQWALPPEATTAWVAAKLHLHRGQPRGDDVLWASSMARHAYNRAGEGWLIGPDFDSEEEAPTIPAMPDTLAHLTAYALTALGHEPPTADVPAAAPKENIG